MSINEDLADAYVEHRLDLLRFEAGTVQRLIAAYDAALSDTREALLLARQEADEGELSPQTAALLQERADALQGELATLLAQSNAVLGDGLEVAVRAEVAITAETVNRLTAGVEVSWVRPPLGDALAAIVEPVGSRGWSDRMAVNLLGLHDDISETIAKSVVAGASMETVATDLGRVLGRTETAHRSRMVALARTEVQRVANTAAMASYQANDDVVRGVLYLATLDSRTCIVCAPLHGTEYPLDAPDIPTPPLHPRCRCFLSPLTKSWAELGLGPAQASLFDGATPSGDDMDFPGWLSRQPAATADAILGPTMADAWRSGVPLEAFSDGRESLTVAEVRARHPSSFPSPLLG